jgi:hypothetical protein
MFRLGKCCGKETPCGRPNVRRTNLFGGDPLRKGPRSPTRGPFPALSKTGLSASDDDLLLAPRGDRVGVVTQFGQHLIGVLTE